MPSSSPFLTPSVQVDVWQVPDGSPDEQTRLSQSESWAQDCPAVQASQSGPPQSSSVSKPFCTWSRQVGAWHSPPVQTPLVHPAASEQGSPAGQGPQPPPQSVPSSLPLCTPSSRADSMG